MFLQTQIVDLIQTNAESFGRSDRPQIRPNDRQSLLNLVTNAVRYGNAGGNVAIAVGGKPNGDLAITVSDDGPGISPEVQARIFEPFFTTKPVGQGTGLGLSISYGIVERHGGRMLVGSAPGEGTTFVIELPLIAKPLEDAGAEETG